MKPILCRGCRKQLSNEADRINIFSSDVSIDTSENVDLRSMPSTDDRVKLSSAIEIITGRSVSKTDGLPINLCEKCYAKLEAFINFRVQLLTSLRILLQSEDPQIPPPFPPEPSDKTEDPEDPELNVGVTDPLLESEQTDSHIDKNSDSSKTSESKPVFEDLINVDEDSMTHDFNDSLQDQLEMEGTQNSNVSNDHENNNFNESNSSSEVIDEKFCKELYTKVQNNDIESDIDVCSGEDDEVLELDVQSKKDEIVEIESSAESDIEVCDYEPTGKRIKNYNAFSSPIYF